MNLQTSQQFIYCPYTGVKISGVAARNCNYCDLETYVCSHSGKPCVAKEGLVAFAQSLAEGSSKITLEIFKNARQQAETEKRIKIYREIAKMWTDKYGDD